MRHTFKSFERYTELHQAAVRGLVTPDDSLPENLKLRLWTGLLLPSIEAETKPEPVHITESRITSDIALAALHAYTAFKRKDEPEFLHMGELVRTLKEGDPSMCESDIQTTLHSMREAKEITYTYDETRRAAMLYPTEQITVNLHPQLLV